MHRRKSSKDNIEQENVSVSRPVQDTSGTVFPKKTRPSSLHFPDELQQEPQEATNSAVGNKLTTTPETPVRTRVNSVPDQPIEQSARRPHPPSAGPYRTSFGALSQLPLNNFNNTSASSPLRKSFSQGHGRTMSSSSSYNPSLLSPPSHKAVFSHVHSRSISVTGSSSIANIPNSPPEIDNSGQVQGSPPTSRRHHHQRIHSRNLSVFFPRPGSLPVAIAEDSDGAGQDLSIPAVSLNDASPNEGIRLQDPPGLRRLGEGFTFGGRPERTISGSSSEGAEAGMPQVSRPKRRGHHHKHSLSHNFFSFLEPGAHLHPPDSSPESSWTPSSAVSSAGPASSTFAQAQAQNESGTAVGLTSPNPNPLTGRPLSLPKDSVALATLQFVLGGALWVSGQQNGSLACTGLGYWVVFDAFGVALRHVLPAHLLMEKTQSKTRRPYGNARIETLALFAQAIYLIFSSVYVCKEAVEHLLLSAGEGGHHHHHSFDEDPLDGLQPPLFLILLTIVSLLSTCLFFNNHQRLLSTCGHKLPSFQRILLPSRGNFSAHSSPLAIIVGNPFTVAPLMIAFLLLVGHVLLPNAQQEAYDLLLALFISIITFRIAYPAAEVQGTVLLQTAPPRGMPGARMENFLRVMREIERHPLVLHLPAPHMWQLTAFPTSYNASSASSPLFSNGKDYYGSSPESLVVTLELHVRRDTDDGEVITLTNWAHERCRLALGFGLGGDRVRDNEDGAEITIGIVKG